MDHPWPLATNAKDEDDNAQYEWADYRGESPGKCQTRGRKGLFLVPVRLFQKSTVLRRVACQHRDYAAEIYGCKNRHRYIVSKPIATKV